MAVAGVLDAATFSNPDILSLHLLCSYRKTRVIGSVEYILGTAYHGKTLVGKLWLKGFPRNETPVIEGFSKVINVF
jgi:hypothetical protein